MWSLLSKLLSLKLLDEASNKAGSLIAALQKSLSKIVFSLSLGLAAAALLVISGVLFLSALFMYLLEFFKGVTPALWTGAASTVVALLLLAITKVSLREDGKQR